MWQYQMFKSNKDNLIIQLYFMSKHFSNEMKWVQAPDELKLDIPFLKGTPLRPIGDNKIQYEVNTGNANIKLQISNEKSHLMSKGQTYDDMCNMDILNEPEVLNNLVQRYKSDKIFTFIGPTLVVVNPYRIIHEYFSNDVMVRVRNKVLEGSHQSQKPHIYLIAGNAFNSMIDQQKKQAIVISGESGAGKTQSTKYCMQLLTSLSLKQTHSIEVKILSCNPILQAFGNSKTLRNDNSSRFGKYVQIYFGKDHTILGANINSYLLEKSRVVAPAEGQRNYHIFYCLIASGVMPLKSPKQYKYLEKSKCYEVPSINDKQYFQEIRKSMENIGFKQKEQKKIWELLSCILELGNIQFDDKNHKQNISAPCELKESSLKSLQKLSSILEIKQADLQKILLFERKVIIKQVIFSAYNIQKCLGNINTLSKAIYNAIFEFILYKIQFSLKPEGMVSSNKLSINILDIFGFQNFALNSFQQFCINFTNEKLLKLYNQYVFQRQMKILKEDGLDNQIAQIKAPTNEALIDIVSGKMSLFSLINDYTLPQQYKDSDIINAFQFKIPKTGFLEFDKLNKSKFTIVHSQCNVKYQIEGFKEKNQDKVIPQIANIVNNLFEHESKEQAGKTLLTKFSKEIDELMQELTSSSVHFIRCIKPNEKKVPKLVQEKYMLTQVRYLGVFETIQIRKKTFPSRWIYEQFIQRFQILFGRSKGNVKEKTQKILLQLTKDAKDYLLGNQRVYMNSELQSKLLKKLHQMMKKKIESGKKIWKAYKKYRFKKQIKQNLKKLSKRIKIWRKIGAKYELDTLRKKFALIKEHAKQKIEQQRVAQQRKLLEAKRVRQMQQKKHKNEKIQKRKQQLPRLFELVERKKDKYLKQSFESIKKATPVQVIKKNVSKNIIQPPIMKKNEKKPHPILDKSEDEMNQTVILQNQVNQNKYERVTKPEEKKNFDIHQSFLNEKSILIQNHSDTAFPGTLSVGFFKPQQAVGLPKLRLILSDKYKPQLNDKQQDFLSPPSEDGMFQIEDTPSDLLHKIIQFDSKTFFKKVLRKRTNFFGISKDEDDILVVKNRPLSKSITLIQQEFEVQAIKIFKQILKIAEESKLQLVFKQVERLIFMCKSAAPEIINEVLLQLVKQSNTPNQLNSIRVVQALAVFLHIYDPDDDFIMGVLNFLFKKLSESSFTQRQNQYFRYVFKKLIRKLQQTKQINYMPIKYQIMALMCKRMISIPIYLPVGSSSHVKVQSYESLSDIKVRVMQELGLDYKRLMPQLFSFFELTNYDGSSQERLLNQNISVWDLISYWQRSSERYIQQNEKPPSFYLILKLRYVYECHQSDQESIQIMFSQCFYDLFMGRVRMGLKEMGGLAACVKKIKYPQNQSHDIANCYPAWAIQKWKEKQLIKQMKEGVEFLNDPETLKTFSQYSDPEVGIKFKFLQIVENAPLSLALSISTQSQFKLHFRHKMLYISENNEIQEEIPIKSITRYAEEDNKFVFQVRNSSKIRIIQTELASICCKHMSLLQDLVTKKIVSSQNYQSNFSSNKNSHQNSNMILSGLQ